MDLSEYQTNDNSELVIKNENRILFGLGAIICLAIVTFPMNMNDESLILATILFLRYFIVILVALFFAYKSLDNKIKILINRTGIGYSDNFYRQATIR